MFPCSVSCFHEHDATKLTRNILLQNGQKAVKARRKPEWGRLSQLVPARLQLLRNFRHLDVLKGCWVPSKASNMRSKLGDSLHLSRYLDELMAFRRPQMFPGPEAHDKPTLAPLPTQLEQPRDSADCTLCSSFLRVSAAAMKARNSGLQATAFLSSAAEGTCCRSSAPNSSGTCTSWASRRCSSLVVCSTLS